MCRAAGRVGVSRSGKSRWALLPSRRFVTRLKENQNRSRKKVAFFEERVILFCFKERNEKLFFQKFFLCLYGCECYSIASFIVKFSCPLGTDDLSQKDRTRDTFSNPLRLQWQLKIGRTSKFIMGKQTDECVNIVGMNLYLC